MIIFTSSEQSGRPRTTTCWDDHIIRRITVHLPKISCKKIKAALLSIGRNISWKTISKRRSKKFRLSSRYCLKCYHKHRKVLTFCYWQLLRRRFLLENSGTQILGIGAPYMHVYVVLVTNHKQFKTVLVAGQQQQIRYKFGKHR